ncbi:MAG: hypothetical protein H0T58_12120 [Gemmatimonadales bacterium]|nr:hypothetical protein [Gemmatimonadales bacterium]
MRYSTRALLTTAILLVQACGDESFSPIVENVAGSYQAATLTATLGDLTTDLLELGSTLTMTLNADGTTEGRLLGPSLGEGGQDLDVDLAGTWTLTGSTVNFDQQGYTFVRDVPFTAERNRLTGEGTFLGTTIVVVLSQ